MLLIRKKIDKSYNDKKNSVAFKMSLLPIPPSNTVQLVRVAEIQKDMDLVEFCEFS
jgi:hypothetical protein